MHPRIQATLRTLPALLLCLALTGCPDSDPVVMMPVEEVRVSLVTVPSAREVLQQHADHPVRAWTLCPSSSRQFDTSPLPALEMVPPARLRVDLGRMPPTAELHCALGLDASAYVGPDSGRVAFELSSPQGTLHRLELPYGPDVPREQQAWSRAVLPLDGVGELVLSTELLEGTGAPRAGMASLEIVTRAELPRTRAEDGRPNIVLVVIDTLRQDRLGCYDYGRKLSPVIDALAERGVLYESAWATSSWTWPSTASILTTLDPAQHGVLSYEACYLSQSLLTIAELLQAEGWTTGAFSSNPLIHKNKDFDQGFEDFREYTWASADALVADASAWVEEHAEWRFFLYLHLTDPHEYTPSPAARERWVSPPPANYREGEWREHVAAKVLGGDHDPARLAATTTYKSELYDATVAQADAALGRLFARLEELGLGENTVIALTSDHGEEFLDHGLCFHGSQLHRELVAAPLILAGPGVPRGVRVTPRVENRFLAPTLLGLAGLDRRDNIDGPDLLDQDAVAEAARRPFFATTNQGIWLATGGAPWKNTDMHSARLGQDFFVWVPETDEHPSAHALYDLGADPDARTDVSAERAERSARYVEMIQKWLEHGAEVRPTVLDGGESARKMLEDMGYTR